MIDGNAPPEVQRAAATVQAWLDAQQKAPAPAARPMTAAEKLDWCRTFDQRSYGVGGGGRGTFIVHTN
jgi:hypothetical protein